MDVFPQRRPLYRSLGRAVSLATIAIVLTGLLWTQVARKPTASKGPRAIGLLELTANGKGHLIPVAILLDGKFYDASAYKADPVPLALESGTVYEAEKTGVSEGLFTISVARQLKDTWIGDGTFQLPGTTKTAKKSAEPSKPPEEDVDKPPTLKRPGQKKTEPAPSPTPPQDAKPEAPSTTASPAPAASEPEPPPDPNRPTLRRGKPVQTNAGPQPEVPPPMKSASRKTSTPAPSRTAGMQTIPAISDANGPEPHSYVYDAKPDETEKFRKQMLTLATAEVLARAKDIGSGTIRAEAPKRTTRQRASASKPPQPSFEDVQLRIFDLSSSNEPVLVLTATAHMPEKAGSVPLPDYYATLVAREDIYGELHKAFANLTDNQHLDVLPRMQLIDAVDADGDGRGELLFRQISDTGTTYSIYRVIGNQLYALFQGT